MITAEEFFRNKVKEQNPNREVITLSQELITAEQGMRWAHEFKQLHLHDVVGRSKQLKALLEKLLNENMCSVVGDELIEEALKGF